MILDVAEAWDQKLEKTLSEDGKLDIVRISDYDWWETEADSYTSVEFDKIVPADATIQSVVIYGNHWEEADISPADPIVWQVGGGDLVNPS